ncbi:hypothetical protein, partial [Bacillus smithii]|uniref:hypothetical protein n=1 Tax=Bacillus smithii TaxID=1479 RepID=UPI002E213B57|nr:hypothetical protein [Bacillus smithii]
SLRKLSKIIFKGLFLLIIWMLFFLVIPVAFKNLKRFKFFSMEFEVAQVEKEAIENIEISALKAQIMAKLSSDDMAGATITFLREDILPYKEVLKYFLYEVKESYKTHPLHASFSYKVFEKQDAPDKLKDLIEESEETAVRNKENQDNLFKKNYLVYSFSYNDEEYVTVVSIYTYAFDILDRSLFLLLHNVVGRNIENIEYMVALTKEN